MSILLICPPKETIYGLPELPRLGIAYLSASLTKNDIEHDVLDLNFYITNWKEALQARIGKHSSFGITSTTFEFQAASEVAKYIKRHDCNSTIIIGGSHATLLGKYILESHHEFDYCLKGEGEESLCKLIYLVDSRSKEEIKNIEGLSYRETKEVKCNNCSWIKNIDDVHFPSYDKFELDKYRDSPKALPILTSRGCPYRCIYCCIGLVMGKKFRARSVDNIINEMEYLIGKYGTSSFSFNDDNLTLDIERVKKLCRRIIYKGLNIKWNAPNGIRVNNIDAELAHLMKESGCVQIAIGIESTNNDVLRSLAKGTTIEIIEKAITLIQKNKIPIKGFFLVGSPGETKKDVYDSLEFARQWLDDARFSMLTPYPGTELWNWVENNNYWTVKKPLEEIIKYTHIGEGKTFYGTPSFSKEEKEITYQEIYRKWERYRSSKTLKGRLIYKLRRYPLVYEAVRKLYQLLKKMAGFRRKA